MSDEALSSLGEEQNYSLREEIVQLDQRFSDSRVDCDEVSLQFEEISEQVDSIKKQQEEKDEDEEFSSLTEENKFEEDLTECKSRVSTCKSNQREQSKIISDLQSKIEEYQARCARLEAALGETFSSADPSRIAEYRAKCEKLKAALGESLSVPDAAKDDSDFTFNVESMLNIETLLLKLEHEKKRCERLVEINSSYQKQLETAADAKRGLTKKVDELTSNYEQMKTELDSKEAVWKKHKNEYILYLSNEHKRLLTIRQNVHNFRSQLTFIRDATQTDLSAMQALFRSARIFVTDACQQLTFSTTILQVEDHHQEMIKSRMKWEAEKAILNQRVQDLQLLLDKSHLELEEKERRIGNLKQTLQLMDSSLNSRIILNEGKMDMSIQTSHLYKTLMDISQIIIDDGSSSDSSLMSNLQSVRNTLLMPQSYSSVTAVEFAKFSASLVAAVQYALNSRGCKVKKLQQRIDTYLQEIQTQQKLIEKLEFDKESLNEKITTLTIQLDTAKSDVSTMAKDQFGVKSTLREAKTQLTQLEQLEKTSKQQIDSLNEQNAQLRSSQDKLQETVQKLQFEKNELLFKEKKLKLDLYKSEEKNALLQRELKEREEEHQNVKRDFQRVLMEKELLEHQKNKFHSEVKTMEKHRSDLDLRVLRLQKDGETLKSSVQSLQDLNSSLLQEKEELSKSLCDKAVGVETAKKAFGKEKIVIAREKLKLREDLELSMQKCAALEIEIANLKKGLAASEVREKEYEETCHLIRQRNHGLIYEVNKLAHQKSLLERELQQAKEEISKRLESKEKWLEEKESFSRERAELSHQLKMAENELSHLNNVLPALREEKDNLAKALYESQQRSVSLNEEKYDAERESGSSKTVIERLQSQLQELRKLRDIENESAARQKDALNQKMQQLQQDYTELLKNAQQHHKTNMDMVIQEKETQRNRLEAARDELAKQYQDQIEKLAESNKEEFLSLQKQVVSQRKQIEDLSSNAIKDKSDREKKLCQEKEALQKVIEELEDKISAMELQHVNSEKVLSASVDHYKEFSEELGKDKMRLQEEMEKIIKTHKEELEKLGKEHEELRQERDEASAEVDRLMEEMKSLEKERSLPVEKIGISNSMEENGKIREDFEQQILVLNQKLKNETQKVDLVQKSLEDVKARLKMAESEKYELKQSLQQANYQVQSLENANIMYAEEHNDMKETLRELEVSRIEARRESQNLRRRLVVSEAENESKDQEISELQVVLAGAEETENELKKEILKLKQKVMEAEASKEASSKEFSNLQRKYLDLEQKIKLQHEEHKAILQETLIGERSFTEQRLTCERALADATEEAQNLRLKLNSAEGKINALEKHISKVEDAKQELENKLQSTYFSLYNSLGLACDSGFQGSSPHLLFSPFSVRAESTRKSVDLSFSPNRTYTRTEMPLVISLGNQDTTTRALDLDFDLIKSAIQDAMQRMFNMERERDDSRAEVKKLEMELDLLKEENRTNLQKLQTLQIEMESTRKDKKDMENQLVTCKSAISYLEQSVQSIQKERKLLSEKSDQLMQVAATAENEKSNFQVKLAEARHREAALKQENLSLADSLQAAEAKCAKAELAAHEQRAKVREIEANFVSKLSEFENLKQNVTEMRKLLSDAEAKNTTLRLSVDRLTAQAEKHQSSESMLQEQLKSLENSYSKACGTSNELSRELILLRRQHGSCEQEKSLLRAETEKLRNAITQLSDQSMSAKEEIETLIHKLRQYELEKADLEGQVMGLKNIMSYIEDSETSTKEKMQSVEKQKFGLEEQISKLLGGIEKTEQMRLKCEKQKSKYEKENSLLRKALEKAEKERQKTEEIASRSVVERAALGKSLSKMELENQRLAQKVQNLQVQLSESEQRHLERLRDLDKRQKFEMQLELERLRGTQKHMEQLITAKDKTYQQKIVSLELEISALQNRLEQTRNTSHHNESLGNATVSFLNLTDLASQRKSADDVSPGQQNQGLFQAHRLSSSKLSRTENVNHSFASHSPPQRMTSTPQPPRRRLEKSFPS